MTQEEKQILLKDLCARLPYHLLGKDTFGKTRELKVVYPTGTIIAQEIDGKNCSSCGFIPYLRPMSSMTEEEKEELENIEEKYFGQALDKQIKECLSSSPKDESRKLEYFASSKIVDYLNKHHFDYRGLIEKGLALEAPEEMYKIK